MKIVNVEHPADGKTYFPSGDEGQVRLLRNAVPFYEWGATRRRDLPFELQQPNRYANSETGLSERDRILVHAEKLKALVSQRTQVQLSPAFVRIDLICYEGLKEDLGRYAAKDLSEDFAKLLRSFDKEFPAIFYYEYLGLFWALLPSKYLAEMFVKKLKEVVQKECTLEIKLESETHVYPGIIIKSGVGLNMIEAHTKCVSDQEQRLENL